MGIREEDVAGTWPLSPSPLPFSLLFTALVAARGGRRSAEKIGG
jgi:hypothetical protein